jgi:hypothetical protein
MREAHGSRNPNREVEWNIGIHCSIHGASGENSAVPNVAFGNARRLFACAVPGAVEIPIYVSASV